MRTHWIQLLAGGFFSLCLLTSFGCPTAQQQQAGGTTDGNVGIDPATVPDQTVSGEPNNTFAQALFVVFDGNGTAHLEGTIATTRDVDVYALGPMTAGDRIIVDVTASGNLDGDAALFDAAGDIIAENDDRNLDANQLDPFINFVVHESSTMYYLAIQSAPLGASNQLTGGYTIGVQVTRNGQVPATSGQIVVLNFQGGTITIPGGDVYTVGVFDTADIDARYSGFTTTVKQQTLATCQENYAGLNIDFRVYPGTTLPAAGTYSEVLFGGFSDVAFGISEEVDPYNQSHSDRSIIFTEAFTPSIFGRVLTAHELGVAIGNVTAHEVGHLLGLNHVDNVNDIMDTTGGANTLLFDQKFITSPLDDTIFYIGQQNSLMLLIDTLGAAQ